MLYVMGIFSLYFRAAPPRAMAPVPQRAPMQAQQPATGMAQPKGPGLMGQMAATAGGVAIGSALVSKGA